MTEELDSEAVAAWRLERQGLTRPGALLDVVARLGGVQAQVLEGAEHALALRVGPAAAGDAIAPPDVRAALWESRTLVRTYTWRGTFHLVPADELEAWLASAAPGMPRPPKLPAERVDALADAIGVALDGEPMTREALGADVARRLRDGGLGERIAAPGGDMFVKDAAARGLLCLADPDGRSSRLTRPDRWLGRALRPFDPEAADQRALRAFLGAYGPADAAELARWSGRGSAKRALSWREALGDDVVEVEVDGRPGWLLADDVGAVRAARPIADEAVHLLPAWDPFTVALPSLVPEAHYKQVFASAGRVEPLLLAGGRAVATWRFARGARGLVTIELRPFAKLARSVRDRAGEAAARLADVLRADRVELA